MTPGVQARPQRRRLGVGAAGRPQLRGSGANVQWNLEGGSITDLSSNSSPSYFNFDSFDQIQVTTGGGDVSVQSGGLAINLVTKSGSNVFKGTAQRHVRERQDAVQQRDEELFNAGANGFLSGNPLQEDRQLLGRDGGPILKNRLWYWGAADRQDINVGVVQLLRRRERRRSARTWSRRRTGGDAGVGASPTTSSRTSRGCLNNDKTTDQGPPVEVQLPAELGATSSSTCSRATTSSATPRRQLDDRRMRRRPRRSSDKPWRLRRCRPTR